MVLGIRYVFFFIKIVADLIASRQTIANHLTIHRSWIAAHFYFEFIEHYFTSKLQARVMLLVIAIFGACFSWNFEGILKTCLRGE
jgi:hypothetical protein